jgi:hypothetical protein
MTNRNVIEKSFFVILVYFLIVGLLSAITSNNGFDAYWHLKMGQDLWESGLSPFIDHYSFTYNGHDIKSPPVIFQSIIYGFSQLFGDIYGLIAFRIIYFVAISTLILYLLRNIGIPTQGQLILIPILFYFISQRLIIRPDLISNIFTILALIIFFDSAKKFSWKNILLFFALLLLWTNYHNPIIGYVIAFALVIEVFFQKIFERNLDREHITKILVFSITVPTLGFLNVENSHFLIKYLSRAPEWKDAIQEYKDTYTVNKSLIVYYLWGLTIFFSLLAIYKKHFGLAFLLLFFGYFSAEYIRLLAISGIIISIIIAYLLTLNYSTNNKLIPEKLTTALVLFISFGLVYITNPNAIHKFKSLPDFYEKRVAYEKKSYPVNEVHYLNTYHSGGNILNNYGIGGFLLKNLKPDYKIYIDGRTNILYPYEHMETYNEVATNPEAMEKAIKKHDVSFAISRISFQNYQHYKNIPDFSLNFTDGKFAIYSKKSNPVKFEQSSKALTFPQCINKGINLKEKFKSEIKLADNIDLSEKFKIAKALNLIKKYSDSQLMASSANRPNELHRLALYLSLSNDDYVNAAEMADKSSFNHYVDNINIAYSYMTTNQHQKSIQTLSTILTGKPFNNGQLHNDYYTNIYYLLNKLSNSKSLDNEILSDINFYKERISSAYDEEKKIENKYLHTPSYCHEIFDYQ